MGLNLEIVFMDFLSQINEYIGEVVFWIIALIIAFIALKFLIELLKNWWLDESQAKFAAGINYVLLEIYFPKNNEIFPKAMEQVFASFYQIYSFGIQPEKKWLEGQFEDKISAEMASSKDGIRFFIKVNKKNRPIIESAIFAQYPGSEIAEVASDYVGELPVGLPNSEYDVMGADMVLGKSSAYPIKTYSYFFGDRKYEEQEVDPLAHLAEVMSALKGEERLWVQTLIRPAGDKLKDEAKKIINEKMGKKAEPKKHFLSYVFEFVWFIVSALLNAISPAEEKSAPKTEEKPKSVSAADMEIIRAVENKASKLAFETITRIIYIDKKDSFSGANFKAATSAFQQFGAQNLNFIRPSKATMTVPERFFKLRKAQTLLNKKREIYQNYINRSFFAYTNVEAMYREYLDLPLLKLSIMNIEELATIFHPPTKKVAATGLGQAGAKKGSPPANLPVEYL